jgi:hypothetical protein
MVITSDGAINSETPVLSRREYAPCDRPDCVYVLCNLFRLAHVRVWRSVQGGRAFAAKPSLIVPQSNNGMHPTANHQVAHQQRVRQLYYCLILA